MAAEPTNECYNPGLFVDNVNASFTPGGGNQQQRIPLNSAAAGWKGASQSAGEAGGTLDSGSVTASIDNETGELVLDYADGVGCPSQPGKCPFNYIVSFDYQITRTDGGSGFSGSLGPAVLIGPIEEFKEIEVATSSTSPDDRQRIEIGYRSTTNPTNKLSTGASCTIGIGCPQLGSQWEGTLSNVNITPQDPMNVDNCGEGECGNNGDTTVPVTYTGCFPPSEPAADPPTEPPLPPDEPDATGGGSAPESGARGPGKKLSVGNGPRSYTFTITHPRTPAAPLPPVNVGEPWYPIYGDEPTDDPSWRFFLPPLFTFRQGAAPSLLPWNGVAVYADPHGGSLELGSPYLTSYMTPTVNMDSLIRYKRVSNLSLVVNGFTEAVMPIDSADTTEWGDVRYRALLNTTFTEQHRTSETNYNVFRSETGTPSYVVKETFKDVDNMPQALMWSFDEGVWSMEGFQISAGNKGERFTQIYGGF